MNDNIPSSKVIVDFVINKNNLKPDIEFHMDKRILTKINTCFKPVKISKPGKTHPRVMRWLDVIFQYYG